MRSVFFCAPRGIRIKIEHRSAVFINQRARWLIHFSAPLSRKAQMQANPSLEHREIHPLPTMGMILFVVYGYSNLNRKPLTPKFGRSP